jgi:DNA (cytosine-5)-methyltransferase 1
MEDRLITVMEARRAQSFPDDEVLLGNNAQAFKIVGNSVARSVALAWGVSMRYAYLEQHNILRR